MLMCELNKAALIKHIEQKNYIRVETFTCESEAHDCMPLATSDKLLFVLNFIDFLPDGYSIIRLKDITSVEHNDSCKYFGKIVKMEGALKLIDEAPDISIDSWKTVFLSLKKMDIIVIADIGKEQCLNVGKITKVRDADFSMHCFCTSGIWDENERHELYTDITSVRFLNHYINTYSKYLSVP